MLIWNYGIAMGRPFPYIPKQVQKPRVWRHNVVILADFAQIAKAKKKKIYVSKPPRAFVFSVRVWFSKIQGSIFFACLIFFQFFMNLRVTNIQEKIWQTQWNTLNNRLLQLLVLSCILFIQKSSFLFQSCDRLKSDTSAAQEKKNRI